MDYKETLDQEIERLLKRYSNTKIFGNISTEEDAEWVLERFDRWTSEEHRESLLRLFYPALDVENRTTSIWNREVTLEEHKKKHEPRNK
jgi:hypothetical protein